jgi:hypothetical protein
MGRACNMHGRNGLKIFIRKPEEDRNGDKM